MEPGHQRHLGAAAATLTGLAFALRADFAAVESQFALQDDSDGRIAQNLMTLVYGAIASAFFFGLLSNTFSTSVPYSSPPGQPDLPPPVVAASGGRLSYNDVTKRLSFAGVLDAAGQAAIDAAIPAGDPGLTAAVASLEAASQQAVGPFFATYPELAPLFQAYVTSAAPAQAKRQALLDSFLPILKAKRKQEQALASVTSAAGTDPSFASALLTDATILHADDDATAAAVADFTAIEQPGLSARFFLGNDPSAAPDQSADAAPALSYAQTATVGGTVTAGDTLTTTINGTAISYTAGAADTTTAEPRRAGRHSPPPSTRPAAVGRLPLTSCLGVRRQRDHDHRPRPVGRDQLLHAGLRRLGRRHRDLHGRRRDAGRPAARSPPSGTATSPCRRTAPTTSPWRPTPAPA